MSKQFRTAYGPRHSVKIHFPDDEGRTMQSAKKECDINLIIDRYDASGILSHVRKMDAKYGDVMAIDFQTAMNIVADGQSAFAQLPSSLRNRFRNEPALFMDFVHNPENAEELIKLGLGKLKETQQEAPVATPAQPVATEKPTTPEPPPET